MPSPDELRGMALSIDGSHEQRVRLEADLRTEAAQGCTTSSPRSSPISSCTPGSGTTWPLLRMLTALEDGAGPKEYDHDPVGVRTGVVS